MGKVIEIGNQELEERRRKTLFGIITLVLVDEWTESKIFEDNNIYEEMIPVINDTVNRIMAEGDDILATEDEINKMREKMKKFMEENIAEDDE